VAGAFMTQLSTTMVNVSLLSLAAELHASLSTIQWVTSGYLLALAVMLPLTGWLVDRIGAKALYLWSFAAFTLSSTLCGLAWSANALIAFRVLQGMSGGLLAPMVQMMIARAAGKHMARIMGYAVVPILLAPILGPVIAGAILQFASWRWLFLVNLPVGAVAIVLAIFFLPNDREETQRRDLDLVGFALLSPGLVLFLYGSDHMGERIGQITVALSVVLLAMFFKVAIRKGDRALIRSQLRDLADALRRHPYRQHRKAKGQSSRSFRHRTALGSGIALDCFSCTDASFGYVRCPVRTHQRWPSAFFASICWMRRRSPSTFCTMRSAVGRRRVA
jgi:EmrB/QacA subfamily drug resistance transporter